VQLSEGGDVDPNSEYHTFFNTLRQAAQDVSSLPVSAQHGFSVYNAEASTPSQKVEEAVHSQQVDRQKVEHGR
jgi:hypothetical protein